MSVSAEAKISLQLSGNGNGFTDLEHFEFDFLCFSVKFYFDLYRRIVQNNTDFSNFDFQQFLLFTS